MTGDALWDGMPVKSSFRRAGTMRAKRDFLQGLVIRYIYKSGIKP